MSFNTATRLPQKFQDDYWIINEAICQVFLSGRFARVPVYLDFEDDAHSALADVLKCRREEVKERISHAVREAMSLDAVRPFDFFEESLETWKRSGYKENPPFIALLAALSIAAENMCSDGNFQANNYYDRLFQFLMIEDESLQGRIRQKFKLTRKYWEAWNIWLVENDGNFGLPTAQQLNGYKYVSYAMSQALVREAERKNLQKMFEHFDFIPGQQMSTEELYPYIQKWTDTFASRMLKTLWKSKGIDQIVIQIAAQELLNWGGAVTGPRDAGTLSRKILLGAQLQGFPQKMRFFLAAQSSSLKIDDKLTVKATSQGAFDEVQHLSLSPCPIPNSFALGPSKNILMDKVLMSDVVLGEVETFTRRSRPIVALALDEGGTYYCEVSRVSLLNPHIVLCRAGARGFVSEFLQTHARLGFREMQASETQNLPAGWVAFRDVQIFRASENADENMQVLVPMSDTSLMVVGGIKLARNIWHCGASVEVSATARDKDFTLNILEQKLGEDDVCIAQVKSSNSSAIASVDPRQLDRNRNFLCTMERDGEVIKSQYLSFRDADKPLRTNNAQPVELIYEPSIANPLGALSASTVEGSFAMKLSRPPDDDGRAIGSGLPFNLKTFNFQSGDLEENKDFVEELDSYGSSSDDAIPTENCTSRGKHMGWICQPHNKGESPSANKWMKCMNCGLVIFVKRRESSKALPAMITPKPLVLPEKIHDSFEQDTILDALCFMGGGGWSQVSNICSHIDGGDLPAYQYIRNIVALGHMDIMLELPSFRPKTWSIAPPHFIETPKGDLVLSGFRCKSLMHKLEEVAKSNGIQVTYHEQHHAPVRISLQGGAVKLKKEALIGVEDSYGRSLFLAGNLSEIWMAKCPTLSSIENALQAVHVETATGMKTEKFDFSDGKWKDVDDDRAPGAYRSSNWNAPHYFVDAQGRKKKASQEVVKFLASRHEKIALIDYMFSDFAITTPLGCPLPGIYERAVISSSGFLPVKRSGRLIYRDVKPELAAALRDRLYS